MEEDQRRAVCEISERASSRVLLIHASTKKTDTTSEQEVRRLASRDATSTRREISRRRADSFYLPSCLLHVQQRTVRTARTPPACSTLNSNMRTTRHLKVRTKSVPHSSSVRMAHETTSSTQHSPQPGAVSAHSPSSIISSSRTHHVYLAYPGRLLQLHDAPSQSQRRAPPPARLRPQG